VNVAFIVQINLDDLSNLPDVSREIQDDLNNAGFEVTKVAPWQRPSLKLGGSNLFTPTPEQPTTEQNINPIV
jgi:hypothetical protein